MSPNLKRFIRWLSYGSKSRLYGSAIEMPWLEKKITFSNFHKGLVIGDGRISEEKSRENLLVAGAPGKGKSTKETIKHLLQLGQASAVVTDSSGEIFQSTSGYLSEDHDIYVLEPLNLNNSLRFNPNFYYTSPEDRDTFSQYIGEHISDPQGRDRFWTSNASDVDYTFISNLQNLCRKGFPEFDNLFNLRHLIQQALQNNGDSCPLDKLMSLTLNDSQFDSYKTFLSFNDKSQKEFLTTARTSLNMCKEPSYDASILTASNNIDLTVLRRKPSVIYIIIPEGEIERMSLFIALFYATVFKVLKSQGTVKECKANGITNYPVYLKMDEFGNAGKIPQFAKFANTARKYGVSITILVQNIRQIYKNYGMDEAEAIIEAMNHKLFLPGIHHPSTLELIQTLCGTKTEVEKSEDGKYEQKVSKPLKSIYEARTLYDDEGVFISTNEPVVIAKCEGYFKNFILNRRSKLPPFRPQYHYEQERVYPLPIELITEVLQFKNMIFSLLCWVQL